MSTESESKLKTLTSKVEYLRASNADGVCVIEGTASWCPQCKAIAPEVEKMTSEFPDARFYKFDVDEVYTALIFHIDQSFPSKVIDT